MSPTTQAGGRTRDLRDGGSTCHRSHQHEKGTPLCLQPPPSLALALFCAAQFLPVAVVFPACLSPPSPPLSSLSATRVPTSPSAPAPLCHPCLQGRCLENRGRARSQLCWAQWQEPLDASHTGMKIATTTTTITRILPFRAWSCQTTWTFLRNADL